MINLLKEQVKESQTESAVIDVVRWINFTTFDIIPDLGWENLSTVSKNKITTLG